VPGIYLIVLLEERELRDRFGRAYEEYCQGVPCFFPRWRRKI
jgi:protein-S-isoprenylcysteine O-methyltransferase Ste14